VEVSAGLIFFNNFLVEVKKKAGEFQKGPSQIIEIQVTLEDLYNGKEIEILQKRQILCTHCRGTGADDPNDVKTCKTCGGSGTRVVEQKIGPGFVQRIQQQCDVCGGKGKISKTVCSKCKGTKVEQGEQMLTVYIEKGMPEGHEIVSGSDADENPGEEPGDIIFKLAISQHQRFVRKGNDLYMTLRISLLEALVGFTFSFKHLDGHNVDLKRTAVTSPGFTEAIPQEGMPIHGNSLNFGQLFVTYQINFPNSVTEAQKEGFTKLLS